MINKKNISKFFILLHILIIGLPMIYFLLFLLNDNRYDIYYILGLLIIRFHWFFFKGECILTYIEKKILNPDYKLGSNIFNAQVNEITNNNYIYKKIKPYSFENFNDIKHNLFIFFILLRNTKSKNFNLILVLSLITIMIQMCWNKIINNYNSKLRKKYKNVDIKKIYI
jgi:hypothetical protein